MPRRSEPPDQPHGSASPRVVSPHQPARRREQVPWVYFLALLVGALLIASAMWYHVRDEQRSILAEWGARVSSTADDRVRLVEQWIGAHCADVEVLAASPLVRASLERPRIGRDALVRHLDRVSAAHGHAIVRIWDAHGQPFAQSSGASAPGLASRHAVEMALARRIDIDLIDEAHGGRVFSLSVPVLSDAGTARMGSGRVLGVVTLETAPDTGLFPLLADERGSTGSGETLLFRVADGRATYLSPFRHQPGDAAAVFDSLEAIRGRIRGGAPAELGEIVDYRGVPVLAATRRITPSGWGLVFKIDRDEALAQLRRARQLAGLAAAFLLLALAGLLIGLWRHRERTRLLRSPMEQEPAILELKGYAETIVASVPAGLLLLGGDLRVLSVNAAFLETVHLRHAAVVGRELGEVVPSEGLLARAREVLRTGQPQRDVFFDLASGGSGNSQPALITMMGIRPAGDGAARLLLIVRDLSEEERLDAARRLSEQRFRDLVQSLDAIVWEADASTLRFSFASERAETLLGWPLERWLSEPEFFATRIDPADRDRVIATCRAAIARGVDHEFEYRARTAEGREVCLRDIVHVLREPASGALQLRGLTVD